MKSVHEPLKDSSVAGVNSPLTGSSKVTLEREWDSSFIIGKYKAHFGVDVSRFFNGISRISLFRCEESGYRFYVPLTTAGDGEFYRCMQQNSGYYMDWKWEHQIASGYINPGGTVLEVGCGEGAFLRQIARKVGADCTGLELNASAVANSDRDTRVKLLNETVEEHSALNRHRTYDVVCSFQVAEHIPSIRSFLDASVEMLREGGHYIFSVPNNDSYLKYYRTAVSNMPPHHMGLWNRESIERITKYLPLSVEAVHLEPLQPYHRTTYVAAHLEGFLYQWQFPFKVAYRSFIPWLPSLLTPFSKFIKGHTILVVFKKIAARRSA